MVLCGRASPRIVCLLCLSLITLIGKSEAFMSSNGLKSSRLASQSRAASRNVVRRTPLSAAARDEDGPPDLYIVGAGYLGKLIGQLWRESYPEATVYGETRTDARHEELRAVGITPVLRSERGGVACPFTVFCAAPSGNEAYADEVFDAAEECWDCRGAFVFTSSAGVFPQTDEIITEITFVDDEDPKLQKQLDAEDACIDEGGTVLRLAGLYSLERGPHNYWLSRGAVDGAPTGLINLISYHDAASLTVRALECQKIGIYLLGSDDNPITREEICAAALQNPKYANMKMPTFSVPGDATPSGKRYNSRATRNVLMGWQPKYNSFQEFMVAEENQ